MAQNGACKTLNVQITGAKPAKCSANHHHHAQATSARERLCCTARRHLLRHANVPTPRSIDASCEHRPNALDAETRDQIPSSTTCHAHQESLHSQCNYQLPRVIQDEVNDRWCVNAARIAGGVFCLRDQLLGVKELPARANAHFIHHRCFKIDEAA